MQLLETVYTVDPQILLAIHEDLDLDKFSILLPIFTLQRWIDPGFFH